MADFIYKPSANGAGVFTNAEEFTGVNVSDTVDPANGTFDVFMKVQSGLVITAAATVPDAFVGANWSVTTGSAANELDIDITALPSDGGAVITDVEYDIGASGTWVSLSTATTGTVTVTMAAPATSYAIRLRAVNSGGNAAAGNSESATSGAAAADITDTDIIAMFTGASSDGYFVEFDDLSTLWQGPGRTNQVTADGQNIAAIDDKSGNGIQFAKVGANNIVYKDSGGLQYLNADTAGTGDGGFSSSDTIDIGKVYSFFIGIRTMDAVGLVFSTGTTSSFGGFYQSGSGSSPHNGLATPPSYFTDGIAVAASTRGGLHTEWVTGSGVVASMEGFQITNATNSEQLALLAYDLGVGWSFTGDVVCAILIEDAALSGTARDDIISYIQGKFS